MANDAQTRIHKDWLNLLQPVGLVVAAPALVKAQAVPSRNVIELQKRLVALVGGESGEPFLRNFMGFFTEVLGWTPEDVVGRDDAREIPGELTVALTEYEEVLSPSYAVPDPEKDGKWLMLVKVVGSEHDLDDPGPYTRKGWHASQQLRFERLLRDTQVPLGLLCNATVIRIVYAPAGESSGHITFPIKAMTEVSGRPILAALRMLLEADRLFTMASDRRLPTVLAESRKYQNEVSTQLSEQVLRALGELLRGFQSADEATHGELLGEVVREDPQRVYGGVTSVLLRLVFLLYAEERGLLPGEPVYVEHYSVSGLFEKLRADAGLYPDTMDQRYGAWARLLSLFRLVFDGAAHGGMRLPRRHGQLFYPDEYPFLEGRPHRAVRQIDERLKPPRISDGVVHRVLEDLLMLDGERLSYRALDVEQIGSVYEAIMGFEVRRAAGPSIAVLPSHVVVNLRALLDAKPGARAKKLKKEANCDISVSDRKALDGAKSVEDAVAALGYRIAPQTRDPHGSPILLATGALYLQPTAERRRQGAHYTPRTLTGPIVRTTLHPILENLGKWPRPEQVLQLKVCDPAMGSGAFLVEACRYLADKLVDSWTVHSLMPEIPLDEDAILHARRLIAQRCLYGIDKNPFAVNLAKLSLWLVTLAKDHAFTFLDHALKHGDSLVGLTRKQIAAFHWDEDDDHGLPLFKWMTDQIGRVEAARSDIFELSDENEASKQVYYREAEDALEEARMTGDLVISAFFSGESEKNREIKRQALWENVESWRRGNSDEGKLWHVVEEMRNSSRPILPFHWEIEFPEVFSREDPGFDAFVGNPPFLGGRRVTEILRKDYNEWLVRSHPGTNGGSDLVAHFFRTAFATLRTRGTLGFLATNSVAQGATRTSGLEWICLHGGVIYSAEKRLRWPGQAAVVVSVVHICRGTPSASPILNGVAADRISAYLLRLGPDTTPATLQDSTERAFQGDNVLGMGFVFADGGDRSTTAGSDDELDTGGDPEDDLTEGVGANSLSEMRRLIESDPRNAERIFPYMDGSTLNASPHLTTDRYVICFAEMSYDEAAAWPDLLKVVEERVKPFRMTKDAKKYPRMVNEWWKFWNYREDLYRRLSTIERTLVIARVSDTFAFAFLPKRMVFHEKLVVFPTDSHAAFCTLQARVHEVWARLFSSTLKDDLQYTPTKCMVNFPLPRNWNTDSSIEQAGRIYYDFRATIMTRNDEGLTATYNRFHDPDEGLTDIAKLRGLHDEMDRAILDAYGWTDIKPRCEFLLDYTEHEEDDSSRRRKPLRYRWPDEIQEEVLARLLDLNQRRVELGGRHAGLPNGKAGRPAGKKGTVSTGRRKAAAATPIPQTPLAFEETDS